MSVYECKQNFQIKYRDVDFKDEMKPSVAMELMAEVAGISADELGIGYTALKPHGYAFIVSNTCIEWVKPIPLYEDIIVKTWPLPPSFAVFQREYVFENTSGEVFANASSRWCLMDMKLGKILPSKTIEGQDYSTYNTRKVFESVQWKLPTFSYADKKPAFTLTIANSEYDHNMHVNNARYADYCMNCFSLEELKRKKLKRFSITYAKQCHEGDTLLFYRKDELQNVYTILGVNDAGETVVRAQLTFVN